MTDRKYCHWCEDELQGVISEFTHCVKCNERRLTEGLDRMSDPCPQCMALKFERNRFSKSDNGVGDGMND